MRLAPALSARAAWTRSPPRQAVPAARYSLRTSADRRMRALLGQPNGFPADLVRLLLIRDGQLEPSLAAPTLQDVAPAARLHSLAKSEASATPDAARLKRSLHEVVELLDSPGRFAPLVSARFRATVTSVIEIYELAVAAVNEPQL